MINTNGDVGSCGKGKVAEDEDFPKVFDLGVCETRIQLSYESMVSY